MTTMKLPHASPFAPTVYCVQQHSVFASYEGIMLLTIWLTFGEFAASLGGALERGDDFGHRRRDVLQLVDDVLRRARDFADLVLKPEPFHLLKKGGLRICFDGSTSTHMTLETRRLLTDSQLALGSSVCLNLNFQPSTSTKAFMAEARLSFERPP